ncbi:hypothetical protein D9M68_880120 [compost metagenome]
MRPPFRFLFGWVIYIALLAAINPVVVAIIETFKEQPLIAPVITALVGVGMFAWGYERVLRRLWSWCDRPRKTAD